MIQFALRVFDSELRHLGSKASIIGLIVILITLVILVLKIISIFQQNLLKYEKYTQYFENKAFFYVKNPEYRFIFT